MAFIRTGMIIVALLLGWVAVRSQSTAHSIPAQTAQFHAVQFNGPAFHAAS